MCATSPPYWGLRDYGTATWEGGDAECEHAEAKLKSRYDYDLSKAQTGTHAGAKEGTDQARWKHTCPKCGARRVDAQLGLESSPEEYVANMVAVFREIHRVLRDDGTVWLNLGSSYWGGKGQSGKASPEKQAERYARGESFNIPEAQIGGPKLTAPGDGTHAVFKPKDLVMIPAMVALALQADGWWLRSDIIWAKPNPMPESVTDRPTTSHEHVFLLAKSKSYFYDAESVREPHARLWEANNGGSWAHTANQPMGSKAGHHSGDYPMPNPAGRNKRTVWTIATSPYSGAHFATFPPKLVEPMIKAGTSEWGACPECGSPWRRVVERHVPVIGQDIPEATRTTGSELEAASTKTASSCLRVSGGDKWVAWKAEHPDTTTGWEPTCDCGHEDTVPCVVLDPFCGSGTVGVVCQELGREFVGIDLSWEYLQLARERTGAKALDEWENGITDDSDLSDLPMFAI